MLGVIPLKLSLLLCLIEVCTSFTKWGKSALQQNYGFLPWDGFSFSVVCQFGLRTIHHFSCFPGAREFYSPRCRVYVFSPHVMSQSYSPFCAMLLPPNTTKLVVPEKPWLALLTGDTKVESSTVVGRERRGSHSPPPFPSSLASPRLRISCGPDTTWPWSKGQSEEEWLRQPQGLQK